MPSPKKLYGDLALQKELDSAEHHKRIINVDPRYPRHRLALIEAESQNAVSAEVRAKAAKSKRELEVKRGLQGDKLTGNILPVNIVDKIAQTVPQYKEGGLIKKTGLVKVHAGELVIKKERVAAVVKAVKAAGLKPLKK